MRNRSLPRALVALPLALGVVGAARPCRAQGAAAAASHEGHAARPSPDDIVALAKVAVAIGQARDSAQKQLALARNSTPQAQQQLREQLAVEIAAIKRRAGLSDAEFRRRTFLVSTDSAARAVYDGTVASLTGAPLPGQMPPPPAPVALPPGPAGVHAGHVVNSFSDTPNGQGLLPTALAEARTAVLHAALAARTPEDLAAIKTHAGHVANAVDPTVVPAGPGLGYGVKRAALGVATHLDLAAKAPGAAPPLATHAGHAGTAARNTVRRADEIVALVKRIQAATTAAEGASLVSQLVALTSELVDGRDADADGKIGWGEGEGGLAQCEEHVKLMLGAPPGVR